MGRSTQYIGLTQPAEEFVKTLRSVLGSDNHTTGMFDEKIQLGEWIDHDGVVYREEVQYEPWSSGPMIFTALRKEGSTEWIHGWQEDASILSVDDFNPRKGLICEFFHGPEIHVVEKSEIDEKLSEVESQVIDGKLGNAILALCKIVRDLSKE